MADSWHWPLAGSLSPCHMSPFTAMCVPTHHGSRPVHPIQYLLFSLNKEGNSDTCHSTDEP